jgi:hypothetical protein
MKASFPKEGLQAFMASNFFSYLLTAFPGLLHPVCSVIYLRYLKSSRKNFKVQEKISKLPGGRALIGSRFPTGPLPIGAATELFVAIPSNRVKGAALFFHHQAVAPLGEGSALVSDVEDSHGLEALWVLGDMMKAESLLKSPR